MKHVLVITDKKDIIQAIRKCFSPEYDVGTAPDLTAAIEMLRAARYDFIFTDLEILRRTIHNNNYKECLIPYWRIYPNIEIIIMTSKDMIREAVKTVKAGASDYITYPINSEELKYLIDNIQQYQIVQSELDYLRDKFWEADSVEHIYSVNPLMKKLYEKIRAVAPTKSTVLLIGETGTGKNLLAKLIHRHSNRRDNQFISVHCGAIPETLLESELFGHEKGAFTGAVKRKLGKFEIARGGTIFLDEIGTITLSAQIKLLQVLQDGTFHRLGGEEEINADVRVIAATNVDLKTMCEEGSFRKDLYYRLNVFPIEIPPLRERVEDIPNLVEGFLKKMNRLNMKDIKNINPQVMDAFRNYSWPGNIRELENLLERAYILETSAVLRPESFPSELFESQPHRSALPISYINTLSEVRRKGIENIEINYLKGLMAKNRGKIKESATDAGITTRQLHKLLSKYNIRKEEFKSNAHPLPKSEP